MIWYSNLRKQGTTGWIWIIGFAPWVNVHNSSCLVYAKFNGLSCMVPGYRFWRFWGGLSLYSVSCTSRTKNSCNTKVAVTHVSSASTSAWESSPAGNPEGTGTALCMSCSWSTAQLWWFQSFSPLHSRDSHVAPSQPQPGTASKNQRNIRNSCVPSGNLT